MSVSGGGDHCSGGGKSGAGGIIIAGWGTSHCHHLDPVTRGSDTQPLVPEPEIDNFRMSFTKRLVSGSGSGPRRKPVLVSRARSDPWRPAGTAEQRRQAGEQGAWCSVCLDPGQGAEASNQEVASSSPTEGNYFEKHVCSECETVTKYSL